MARHGEAAEFMQLVGVPSLPDVALSCSAFGCCRLSGQRLELDVSALSRGEALVRVLEKPEAVRLCTA